MSRDLSWICYDLSISSVVALLITIQTHHIVVHYYHMCFGCQLISLPPKSAVVCFTSTLSAQNSWPRWTEQGLEQCEYDTCWRLRPVVSIAWVGRHATGQGEGGHVRGQVAIWSASVISLWCEMQWWLTTYNWFLIQEQKEDHKNSSQCFIHKKQIVVVSWLLLIGNQHGNTFG